MWEIPWAWSLVLPKPPSVHLTVLSLPCSWTSPPPNLIQILLMMMTILLLWWWLYEAEHHHHLVMFRLYRWWLSSCGGTLSLYHYHMVLINIVVMMIILFILINEWTMKKTSILETTPARRCGGRLDKSVYRRSSSLKPETLTFFFKESQRWRFWPQTWDIDFFLKNLKDDDFDLKPVTLIVFRHNDDNLDLTSVTEYFLEQWLVRLAKFNV